MLAPTSTCSKTPKRGKNQHFTPDEDDEMWLFLLSDQKNVSNFRMWEDFRDKAGCERSSRSLYNRFYNQLAPNLHNTQFDIETKLKLYKKYEIRIYRQYLHVLEKEAELEIDENDRLVNYKMKPASLTSVRIVKQEPRDDPIQISLESEHLSGMPSQKRYLESLRRIVAPLYNHVAGLEDIRNRINTALSNVTEEETIPLETIKAVMDIALKVVGK